MDRAAARIADTRDPEPHALLGLHPSDGGWETRVWRPGARSVRLHVDGRPLAEVASGLFVAALASRDPTTRYAAIDADGRESVLCDPYAFLPTLGELDLHLLSEGRHEAIWTALGARPTTVESVAGVAFTVWAPNARAAAVVGGFNGWDARCHPMRTLGGSGVWELFIPGLAPGERYKFRIRGADGGLHERTDPLARAVERPPRTAAIVATPVATPPRLESRASEPHGAPISIYEVHLPSWRRNPDEGNRSLTYLELADELVDHVAALGFTHVELLPITAHPFSGSWGYQTTGYYAPMPELGSADDLVALVARFHEAGIGVILDWVPAHFPKDEWALARFDGSPLYEHADPRRGEHPDWGTFVFNHGRNEVRNFLVGSAEYWLEVFGFDGIRVDAVASMLYRDYSREEGEWVPGPFGEREDDGAIGFLRELNAVTHRREPGVIMAAEESTAWPGVSRPIELGGLGFGFKWNMGWMHDTLDYFSRDPVHRIHHHGQLTFGLLYAFSENFILPLSHDEVVHGKGSLLSRMPGDEWQRLANLRALYGHMWAHPGKQLLFMGGELAQPTEWNSTGSVEWHLRDIPAHAGVARLVADLNRRYRDTPALWKRDGEPDGFAWLSADDASSNILAYARFGDESDAPLVCVANLSPVTRVAHRIPLPRDGQWHEVLNTDDVRYGGSNVGNAGPLVAEPQPLNGHAWSAPLTLAPLSVTWLQPG
ncbi:MAG: 1,4-alpha-glucan branching protein GlgB [Actinobacteria bacterium]|nr:1,4-alpha-glucan branching protein GlgB [Actinomycetota bacterium]